MAVTPRFIVYKDEGGNFRWRLRGPDGQVIAESADNFISEDSCRRGIDTVRKAAQDADVMDMTRRRGPEPL